MKTPVERSKTAVRLIDQRKLPSEETWLDLTTPEAVAQAITDMVVRGAPAIGITAAFGVALGATTARGESETAFDARMEQVYETLAAARPTAINLGWAIERMRGVAVRERAAGADNSAIATALEDEAGRIHAEDLASCLAMGRHGAELVPQEATVLTHCNAGALATAGYGTALGVIRSAVEAGKRIRVLADETRPFLQGRLTEWELRQDGIETLLIADVSAGHLMHKGEIDLVVVGSDRIAANGDVANKIGTYSVAVLAREHGIPFYVAAPMSTVDFACPNGDAIPIEQRDPREIDENSRALNPAFDVTPARYVTAIFTEKGVARAPYERSLREMVTPPGR